MIRVVLPAHLRILARASVDMPNNELLLDVEPPVTRGALLDVLEAKYPMLRGTIRDQMTLQRRPFLRFFACQEDLSHTSASTPLPDAVVSGKEPYIILGAIAGG